MKSRNKFATCRGVDEHEYYDEYSGQFKTFKSRQWTDQKVFLVITFGMLIVNTQELRLIIL